MNVKKYLVCMFEIIYLELYLNDIVALCYGVIEF
jgi:hypothetical protein